VIFRFGVAFTILEDEEPASGNPTAYFSPSKTEITAPIFAIERAS